MTPIQTSSFIGGVDSRIGGRRENQDSYGFTPTPLGLLVVVCDGMGGGPGGRFASTSAVEIILRQVGGADPQSDRMAVLETAIQTAHRFLLQKGQENPALQGMGTTVAALLIDECSAIAAHVGDSRIYQLRSGTKKYRTFDHSMVFEMVRNKTLTEEQARLSAQSNVITQALGAKPTIRVAMQELAYEKGDRFMLCTDGIWGILPEKELIRNATRPKSPTGAVESLIIRIDQQGQTEGGRHDNLTVALLETTTDSLLKEKMSKRTKTILAAVTLLCGLSLLGNLMQYRMKTAGNTYAGMIDSLKRNGNELSERLNATRDSLDISRSEIERLKQTEADLQQSLRQTEKRLLHEQQYRDERTELQEIVGRLDRIIERMQTLGDEPQSAQKEHDIKQLQDNIKQLKRKCRTFGIQDSEWRYKNKDITFYLGQSIAKEQSDKAKGHYKELINNIVDPIRKKVDSYSK